jgi:F-type H+-transporting ATPase subunit epsilon
MKLHVTTPARVALQREVSKVLAEGTEGAFCLLPRHADYAAALARGLLGYIEEDSQEEGFVALDGGTLVKCGAQVTVCTPRALVGPRLGQLEGRVERFFAARRERELRARVSLERIELDFVRRFIELQQRGRL